MFEAINNSKFPGIEYTAHLPTKIPHEHEDDTFQQKLSMKIQAKPNEQQGRIPRWYTFLKDKITRQSNTGRLNIDLGTNLIQNPKVQRLRPPPVTNEPISYKGRFTVWRSTMYIEHWIPVPGTNNSNGRQHTPRSTPALPILHWTFYS
uniref:Uncharacterized protein n=1 Tax=Rhizophagus irregularis (strain DAOM 181602 / DAOM 197198 / MUCL 43194) TaxID=747089 RepID=U9TYN4_RHIID